MGGIKALRKLQIGLESTAGTPVAATAIWRGMGTLEDKRVQEFIAEDVGLLQPTDRTAVTKYLAQIKLDKIAATFEQVQYLFETGIKAVGTGVADGAGSGKIYAYPFPTTAANTIQTLTVEGGDNQQAEEAEYCHCTEFTLAGEAGGLLTMEGTLVGRQVQTTTYTGSLTVPTVEEILFGKGQLFIDAATGTIGSTAKSNTLMGMTLKVKTGLMPQFTGDGNSLTFAFVQTTPAEVLMDITFLHDATAVAEIAAWRAETARAIRLQWLGSALGTPGTTHTYKTLRADLYGKWESFSVLGEKDGNDVVTGKFRGRYHATPAALGTLTVVNLLATVP